MRALIQRVSKASVRVSGDIVAEIQQGMLALIAVTPQDTPTTAQKLLDKLLHYRLFADQNDKMNLSLQQIEGGLLLVPQFTLAADTSSGLRPSFSGAASPQHARTLFQHLCDQARSRYTDVAEGRFGADMKVALINDGPVTFWLEVI